MMSERPVDGRHDLAPADTPLNLACLTSPARPIVQAAAGIYLRHLAPWFIGLIAHGSAVKGGVIAGCSDLDLQLYLDDGAFTAPGELPLSLGLAIHAELAQIDPVPFSAIQCFAFPPRLRPGYVGPIPGAYAVVAGHLPVPEASDEELREAAARGLAAPELVVPYVAATLLCHGGWELKRRVRHVCTDVWPALYHVLTLQQQDGVRVWGLPKEAAIALLPPNSALGDRIGRFYEALHTYYPAAASPAHALAAIEHGIAFLHAAQAWWQEKGQGGADDRR